MEIEEFEIVDVKTPAVFIEKDSSGTIHLMCNYPDEEPFEFVRINYDYRFTSNGHQKRLLDTILNFLGCNELKIKRLNHKESEKYV